MNILSKFQLSSSSGLGLTVFWIYFHKPWLNYLVSYLNYGGDCRTDQATPGLLIICTLLANACTEIRCLGYNPAGHPKLHNPNMEFLLVLSCLLAATAANSCDDCKVKPNIDDIQLTREESSWTLDLTFWQKVIPLKLPTNKHSLIFDAGTLTMK